MSRQSVTTDCQQICTWLGLPSQSWPPDYYTLLGLPPVEPNIERIEQCVHERMVLLRGYQLSYPALATEAMTCVAKAYDCLTNPACKKAYDAAHFPHLLPSKPAVASARVPTVIANDTAENAPVAPPTTAPAKWWTEQPLEWQSPAAPPPVRSEAEAAEMPPLATPVMSPEAPEPPPVRVAPPVVDGVPQSTSTDFPVAAPAPVTDTPPIPTPLSQSGKNRLLLLSRAAMQDFSSQRDLCDRLWWFRRFRRAWDRAGKYVGKPKRRLTRPGEDAELTRLLLSIDDLLQDVPHLLGQPGQPGYRVLALTRQEPLAEQFKALDDDQREALANDWTLGRTLLTEYRELLKLQVKDRRRQTLFQRCRHKADAVLTAHWKWILLVLVVMVVLILAAATLL